MKSRSKLAAKKGLVCVEFAILAPVLVVLILGTVEYAQLLSVSQVVGSASRRGARLAARDSTTDATEVRDFIDGYISSAIPNLSPDALSSVVTVAVSDATGAAITGGDLNAMAGGAKINVDVSLNYDSVRWLNVFPNLSGKILTESTVVRRE